MGSKIVCTGLALSVLLCLATILKGSEAPLWFKTLVVITGLAGLLMAFVGLLWVIWE